MPLEALDPTAVAGADQEFLYTLNFGPQHPATHTTLRLILTLDGETIVKAVPDIGFLHSGFEKLGEHLDFNQYVTIVDRMNYISPIMNEVAWSSRHRLPAQRLREARRTPRLQSIRHHRRSDELHLADHERGGLVSCRRKADEHRADAAMQVRSHHRRRAGPYQRSP